MSENAFARHLVPSEEEFLYPCLQQVAEPDASSLENTAFFFHDSYSRGSTRHFENDLTSHMNPVSLHFLNRWRK